MRTLLEIADRIYINPDHIVQIKPNIASSGEKGSGTQIIMVEGDSIELPDDPNAVVHKIVEAMNRL